MKNYTKKIIDFDKNITYHNEIGDYHRTDGPACLFSNGDIYYYINGERHRSKGPAAIECNGRKYYYKFGQLHRLNAPAAFQKYSLKYFEYGLFKKEVLIEKLY